MVEYIGLDVSLKDTAISIREDGKRIWRGKCPSDPQLLAQIIRKHAPHAKRVVFETGPLSTWSSSLDKPEQSSPGCRRKDFHTLFPKIVRHHRNHIGVIIHNHNRRGSLNGHCSNSS
ncbi:hypothetical protein JOH51_006991 [Rhizobium leguminosarum]|nr:hypothetical protein [Rhizobium leguminosarum]